MRNLLPLSRKLIVLLTLGVLSISTTSASANHEARYLAEQYRLDRKAVADAYNAQRDEVRYAHREALKSISYARKHVAHTCPIERRAALRELDRRKSAEVNSYRFTMSELDAAYRADKSRLSDQYRANTIALRRRSVPVPSIPVPIRHVHTSRYSRSVSPPVSPVIVERIRTVEGHIPHIPLHPPVRTCAPPRPEVDVPRLIGGILDLYLSVR